MAIKRTLKAIGRERSLNNIVNNNLFGTRSDPDREGLLAAAEAYKLLVAEGLSVQHETSVLHVLTTNNEYGEDFCVLVGM